MAVLVTATAPVAPTPLAFSQPAGEVRPLARPRPDRQRHRSQELFVDENDELWVDTTAEEMAAGMGPRRRFGTGVPRSIAQTLSAKDRRRAEARRREARKAAKKGINTARWAQDRGRDPLADLLGPRKKDPKTVKKPNPKPARLISIGSVQAAEELRGLWGADLDHDLLATGQVSIQVNASTAITDYNIYVSDYAAGNTSITTTPIPTIHVSGGLGSGSAHFTHVVGGVGPIVNSTTTAPVLRFSMETAQDMHALWGEDYAPFTLPAPIPEVDLVMQNKINPDTLELVPCFKLVVRDPAGWTQENLNKALMMSSRLPAGSEVVYEDPVTGLVGTEPFGPLAPDQVELRAKREAKIAAERAEQARRDEERRKKHEAVKSRALGLLLRFLTPAQREEYKRHKYFHVTTRRRHRYRINHGHAGNIVRVNRRGRPMRGYCIVAQTNVPDEDAILAQKLLLENNEDYFLKTANPKPVKHRMRFGGAPILTLPQAVDTFTPVPAGVPIADHLAANGVDVLGTGVGIPF